MIVVCYLGPTLGHAPINGFNNGDKNFFIDSLIERSKATKEELDAIRKKPIAEQDSQFLFDLEEILRDQHDKIKSLRAEQELRER